VIKLFRIDINIYIKTLILIALKIFFIVKNWSAQYLLRFKMDYFCLFRGHKSKILKNWLFLRRIIGKWK